MSETAVGLGTVAETPQQTNGAAKTRGTTTNDPKLVACIRIVKALGALSDADRNFVLSYVNEKYPQS